MTAGKKKISGRIVYAPNLEDSQIYWTCPTRKCKEIHYFQFQFPAAGIKTIYQKDCSACKNTYIATQVNVTGSTSMLVAVFQDEESDEANTL